MNFSHVFISRPRKEAEELAAMIQPLGLQAVIQPAFGFSPLNPAELQPDVFAELQAAGTGFLLVFTSTRAVAHGLAILPRDMIYKSRVAAIGPATAAALGDAGIPVSVVPREGYTSEALLETLAGENRMRGASPGSAFIVAAPGGRQKLLQGLSERGWKASRVHVYEPVPEVLDKAGLSALQQTSGLLAVWTSANAMKSLSQRMQTASWFRICQGDWLVISERLKRLARAYGPTNIHLAQGPGNTELFAAIRSLC